MFGLAVTGDRESLQSQFYGQLSPKSSSSLRIGWKEIYCTYKAAECQYKVDFISGKYMSIGIGFAGVVVCEHGISEVKIAWIEKLGGKFP